MNKNTILTAAHCQVTKDYTVKGFFKMISSYMTTPLTQNCTHRSLAKVWAGGIKRDGSDKKQEVNIKKVKNHPQYDKKTSDHDITILELRWGFI